MTKTIFKEIVDKLWPLVKMDQDFEFDYPDYGKLPKIISNNLSSEAVDAMQITISNRCTTKAMFRKHYNKNLRILGEPIK